MGRKTLIVSFDILAHMKILKFINSEKTTKFCEISTLLLTDTTQDKSKVEISQNFVAFSEYMNFKIKQPRSSDGKTTNSDFDLGYNFFHLRIFVFVKFIYSEKATKFCEIFTLLLSYVVSVKSKVKIFQNFVAFSEYMNFKKSQKIHKNFGPFVSVYLGTKLLKVKMKMEAICQKPRVLTYFDT